MDLSLVPTLTAYITRKRADRSIDVSEQARIQNVLLEERSARSTIDLYASHLAGSDISDANEWNSRHNDFVAAELEIDQVEPAMPCTFRKENDGNRLPSVDRRINLVRVEDARWPCSLSGNSFEMVSSQIAAYRSKDPKKATTANHFLGRFTATWNAERDKRPLFATTELEVEHLLQDTSSSWVEKLRDRLGLGNYSPAAGARSVPVFVMRYPLEDVYIAQGENGAPAVPTMLDSRLNDFFFPSPTPGPTSDQNPCLGHSLNLTLVSAENDYRLGVELLHGRLDYRPEHFFGTGIIANPVTMPIDRARRFHLPWLRLYLDRFDFGSGIVD